MHAFTPPRAKTLRWLADSGPEVPAHIRNVLLGEMFQAPRAVLAGMVNGLMINGVALCMHRGLIFLLFMVMDVTLVTVRMGLARAAVAAAAREEPTRIEPYLLAALGWCALQGMTAFAAMTTGSHALQLLSAVSVMGVTGPACARNYAAPRYAVLLLLLLLVPFVAGALSTGDPWLIVMVLQVPLFLFGSVQIVKRFQTMSVAALQAQYESQHRARHDTLTSLLNRFGLTEALAAPHVVRCGSVTLFYLDLDGFKQVNDTHGHHAGDAVLIEVADRLRSVCRSTDLVARLGGDEFVIVAPNLPASGTAAFADSIIARIRDQPISIAPSHAVRVGVSIGYSCASGGNSSMAELHLQADAALYESKGAGRGVHRQFNDAKIPDLAESTGRMGAMSASFRGAAPAQLRELTE